MYIYTLYQPFTVFPIYFILSLFPSLRQEIFRNAVFRTSADRTVAYTYTYAILLHGTVRLFIEEDIRSCTEIEYTK